MILPVKKIKAKKFMYVMAALVYVQARNLMFMKN
jgi:hypothetical protein